MHLYEINELVEKRRIQLNRREKIIYFIFPITLVAGMLIWLILEVLKPNFVFTFTSLHFNLILVLFSLSGFVIYKEYKGFELKTFLIPNDQLEDINEDFQEAATAASIELNWKIEKLDEHIFTGSRTSGEKYKRVEKITIIQEGNKVYINSITEPYSFLNLLFSRSHERNIRVFLNYLFYARKTGNAVEKAEARKKDKKKKILNEKIAFERDWASKFSPNRLATYFFIGCVSLLCTYALVVEFHFEVLIILILCLGFIIVDWRATKKARGK